MHAQHCTNRRAGEQLRRYAVYLTRPAMRAFQTKLCRRDLQQIRFTVP